MRRRDFITLLGGAAASSLLWPLAAHAQQPAVPVIGYLHTASPGPFARYVAAFRQGLRQMGFVNGQNVAIEYRWADGQYDRLPALAADLVARGVALIVAQGGANAPLAAKAATSTIPIVFTSGRDPMMDGLVASLNRPGGNATGVSLLTNSLAPKRLEIIRELVPKAETIGLLVNPENRLSSSQQIREAEAAVQTFGLRMHVFTAGSAADFEQAFTTMVNARIGALVVGADGYFNSQRERIVALAARHSMPAIYEWRDYVEDGGLMSYGSDLAEGYRQVGLYAGRILKGESPADLPVVQSTKVEFVVNLNTARTLGLTFSLPLIGRADEVIE
jgi:putative ABC transport system substrate-binding protein